MWPMIAPRSLFGDSCDIRPLTRKLNGWESSPGFKSAEFFSGNCGNVRRKLYRGQLHECTGIADSTAGRCLCLIPTGSAIHISGCRSIEHLGQCCVPVTLYMSY